MDIEKINYNSVFEIGEDFFEIHDLLEILPTLNISLSNPVDCLPTKDLGLFYSLKTKEQNAVMMRSNIEDFGIFPNLLDKRFVGVASFGNGIIVVKNSLTEVKTLILVHIKKGHSKVLRDVLKVLSHKKLHLLTEITSNNGDYLISAISSKEWKLLS